MENMTVINEKRLSVPINHSLEIDNIKEESLNPEEDALLKSDSDKLNGGVSYFYLFDKYLKESLILKLLKHLNIANNV